MCEWIEVCVCGGMEWSGCGWKVGFGKIHGRLGFEGHVNKKDKKIKKEKKK